MAGQRWWLSAGALLVVLLAAACSGGSAGTREESVGAAVAPTVATPAVTTPVDATPAIVRVELLRQEGGKATLRYWGSGVFVGPGVILTSARLLDPSGGWNTIAIATVGAHGEAASIQYQADVVAIDPSLDVAVLRVVAGRDGTVVNASALRVTSLGLVPAGRDAEAGGTALGYTAVDAGRATAATLQFTRGTGGGTDWLEASTLLSAGFGGGPVLNGRGEIIGMVALPEPEDDRLYIRRVDEVRPLVAAALAGKELMLSGRVRLTPPERTALDQSLALKISAMTFYADANDKGEPVGPVTGFDSAARRIVYSFEYAGMRPGAQWLDEWLVDGRVDPQLSPARPAWDRGASGRLVAAVSDPQGLPDGVYTLRVMVEGLEVARVSTRVGQALAGPELSRLTIAPAKGDDGQPLGQSARLGSATALYGAFDFEGMEQASRWGYVWYHEGEAVARRDGLLWRGGAAGSGWWVALYNPDGSLLANGTYRVEVLVDGRVASSAQVAVDGG